MMNTESVAKMYLAAWNRKDAATIKELVASDAVLFGPNTSFKGKEAYAASAERMFPLLTGLEVKNLVVQGNQAVAVYDFVCIEPVGVCRTAEVLEIDDGLIRSSQLFFDPRPFGALAQGGAK